MNALPAWFSMTFTAVVALNVWLGVAEATVLVWVLLPPCLAGLWIVIYWQMITLTAVLAFVAFPQDPETLESVLERMDAAAIESRGARAVVRSAGDYAAGEVAVARDGTVRLRADGGANEFTLSPEALYLTHRDSGPIRHSSWRGLRVVNERLVPLTAGPHNPLEYEWEGLLLRALAPALALTFERNLRLAGRRRLGGREFYLLVSRPRLVRWVGPVN